MLLAVLFTLHLFAREINEKLLVVVVEEKETFLKGQKMLIGLFASGMRGER